MKFGVSVRKSCGYQDFTERWLLQEGFDLYSEIIGSTLKPLSLAGSGYLAIIAKELKRWKLEITLSKQGNEIN